MVQYTNVSDDYATDIRDVHVKEYDYSEGDGSLEEKEVLAAGSSNVFHPRYINKITLDDSSPDRVVLVVLAIINVIMMLGLAAAVIYLIYITRRPRGYGSAPRPDHDTYVNVTSTSEHRDLAGNDSGVTPRPIPNPIFKGTRHQVHQHSHSHTVQGVDEVDYATRAPKSSTI